jgi:Tol biopolymer transport system component
LTLGGEPIRVASGVTMAVAPTSTVSQGLIRSAVFAVSQTGVLAYRAASAPSGSSTATASPPEEQRTLFWLDRNGQRVSSVGTTGGYAGLDLSPDGRRVAVHRHEGSGGDSWILDLNESRVQRLTFDTTQENSSPIWSPDGARIAFSSRRNNKWGIYAKPADGTGAEELIIETDARTSPMSWTPDGKQLVYFHAAGNGDVWAVPVAGDRKPIPILQTQFSEVFPHLSPDGKWLAYMSNETGRSEIYVKPFPDGPGKWQVSTDGGAFPRWRADGRELFFFFGAMFAADIRVAGASLRPGVPRRIFGLADPSANHFAHHRFAVSPDGQRFLVSQPGPAGGAGGGGLADQLAAAADQIEAPAALSGNPVTVILNWTRLLNKN